MTAKGLSLGWQVAALAGAAVLMAQAAAFGVLLLWPPPEPARMGVNQVVAAATAPDASVRAAGLRRRPVERVPAMGSSGFDGVIAASLAEGLGLPLGAVRVRTLGELGEQDLPVFRATLNVQDLKVLALRRGRAPFIVMTPRATLQSLPPNLPPFEAGLRRPDGGWLVIGPRRPWSSLWQLRVLLAFAATAVLVAPLAWWSARRVTRPVRLFAEAAERLGLDPRAASLAVEGPAEVRSAALAFNRMQDRLRSYVEGRTAMIAAIAHDLRTPLTGLRLRAETAPPAECARMVADITRMEAMIAQVSAFVRGEQVHGARKRLDLAELAAECVQEARARGGAATVVDAEPLPIDGEALNLRRALDNLVANALVYGECARVSAHRRGDRAVVAVEDDGPGLPTEELERVFEPFFRLEPSRSRLTGGLGLGLAIARGVARSHSGEVVLRNGQDGGLIVELDLPLRAS